MTFYKGMPKVPGSGRPKGSLNRATLLSVDSTLATIGVNPVAEILKLIPELQPKDAVTAYLQLLKYCFPSYKEIEFPITLEQVGPSESSSQPTDTELLDELRSK